MPRPPRFAARRALIARRADRRRGLAAAVGHGPARAQEAASPPPTAAVRSRMTPERLAAIMEASNRQLNYLPGEVLVQISRRRHRRWPAARALRRSLAAVARDAALVRQTSRSFTTRVNQTRTCWRASCGFSPTSCGPSPTTCVGRIACSRTIRASRRSSGTCARSTCRAPGTSIPAATRISSSRSSIRA